MPSQILESGNNVRGLRSIKVDFDEGVGDSPVLFFPDDRDLKLDLTDMDLVEFWVSHWNLIGINTSTCEFRLKTKGNNYYKITLDLQANNWIQHQIYKSQFSSTGSPDWSDINIIEYYFPNLGSTITFEDFEDVLSGWTISDPTRIFRSTNNPKNGSYSLEFNSPSYEDAVYNFSDTTTGKYKFSYWVYIDTLPSSSFFRIQLRSITPADMLIEQIFNGSTGWFQHNENGWQNVFQWSFDTWYHVINIVDIDDEINDVYIYNDQGDLVGSKTQCGLPSGGDGGDMDQIRFWVEPPGGAVLAYVDNVLLSSGAPFGSFQLDGFVIRRREVSAVAENIESQKIWGVRDLPLLDKDIIDKNTAQELVNTILYYSQYPTIRTDAQSPLIKEDILGKSTHITSKGMKWLLPIHHVKVKLTSQKEIMSLQLGRKTPSIEEILSTYGIDQDRIKIGGSGIDWGSIVEQFDKACFQTCETTCQVCGYGAVCQSSCRKTGCLLACQISLCMSACQTIRDRYENWCSGSSCQTCAESGPIV